MKDVNDPISRIHEMTVYLIVVLRQY